MTVSPQRPDSGPSRADAAEEAAFARLVDASLVQTQASAEKWRNALAGLVALITGGLLLKGPEDVSTLEFGWKVVLAVLVGAGFALVAAGLWIAATAAFGAPGTVNLDQIRDRFGNVRGYEVAAAHRVARSLRRAKVCVAMALPLLVGSVFLTWWAPTADETTLVEVNVAGTGATVCGELAGIRGGEINVISAGSVLHTVAVADVDHLSVVDACP